MRLPFFGADASASGARCRPCSRRRRASGGRSRPASFLDAAAPARRLARPVAGASEDSRKHVRLPIDHVGVAVAAFGDQPDVFGHGRVSRAGPLAVDDFVEVVRIPQCLLVSFTPRSRAPSSRIPEGSRDAAVDPIQRRPTSNRRFQLGILVDKERRIPPPSQAYLRFDGCKSSCGQFKAAEPACAAIGSKRPI